MKPRAEVIIEWAGMRYAEAKLFKELAQKSGNPQQIASAEKYRITCLQRLRQTNRQKAMPDTQCLFDAWESDNLALIKSGKPLFDKSLIGVEGDVCVPAHEEDTKEWRHGFVIGIGIGFVGGLVGWWLGAMIVKLIG